jgi:hypothetical protein
MRGVGMPVRIGTMTLVAATLVWLLTAFAEDELGDCIASERATSGYVSLYGNEVLMPPHSLCLRSDGIYYGTIRIVPQYSRHRQLNPKEVDEVHIERKRFLDEVDEYWRSIVSESVPLDALADSLLRKIQSRSDLVDDAWRENLESANTWIKWRGEDMALLAYFSTSAPISKREADERNRESREIKFRSYVSTLNSGGLLIITTRGTALYPPRYVDDVLSMIELIRSNADTSVLNKKDSLINPVFMEEIRSPLSLEELERN